MKFLKILKQLRKNILKLYLNYIKFVSLCFNFIQIFIKYGLIEQKELGLQKSVSCYHYFFTRFINNTFFFSFLIDLSADKTKHNPRERIPLASFEDKLPYKENVTVIS